VIDGGEIFTLAYSAALKSVIPKRHCKLGVVKFYVSTFYSQSIWDGIDYNISLMEYCSRRPLHI
jgi:hypothetical protein